MYGDDVPIFPGTRLAGSRTAKPGLGRASPGRASPIDGHRSGPPQASADGLSSLVDMEPL
jgi:hypothetical protein